MLEQKAVDAEMSRQDDDDSANNLFKIKGNARNKNACAKENASLQGATTAKKRKPFRSKSMTTTDAQTKRRANRKDDHFRGASKRTRKARITEASDDDLDEQRSRLYDDHEKLLFSAGRRRNSVQSAVLKKDRRSRKPARTAEKCRRR